MRKAEFQPRDPNEEAVPRGLYRQNREPRTCCACEKPINDGEWMSDLLRQDPPPRKVAWVHWDCARKMVESWARRKQEKEDG